MGTVNGGVLDFSFRDSVGRTAHNRHGAGVAGKSHPSFITLGGRATTSGQSSSSWMEHNDSVRGDANVEGTVVRVGESPIPEPSNYALMLAGLAAVGFVARRRRST